MCGVMKETNFFETQHCKTRAHCKTCRDKVGGHLWRQNRVTEYEIPTDPDFDCIRGLPWGAPRQRVRNPPKFADIRKKIESAPQEGAWVALKDSLRVTLDMIDLHRNFTPCWRRRQEQRIVQQYEVVRAKNGSNS